VLEKVIVAGFGGQGIVFLGKLLAQAMMQEGENVTYFPAYGPEIRGGWANCHVIISSDEIFSPVVARADTLLAFSQPAWEHFVPRLKPDGLGVLNASMVDPGDEPRSQRLVPIPATDLAAELGDVRAANMVMLGAYNYVRNFLPLDTLLRRLGAVFTGRKADLLELNRQAIQRGAEAAAAALTA